MPGLEIIKFEKKKKIPANPIQQHIKRIIYHDQVRLTLRYKDDAIYANQ